MGLLAVAFALVGVGALVVAAKAIGQLGQVNQAMLVLLADNLASERNDQRATRASLSANHAANQEHLLAALSAIQGSVGVTLTDAVARTATAIGTAVQTATTPVVAPLSLRDEAERAARDLTAQGAAPAGYVEPVDDMDPTDRWIAPDRRDADLVAPGDRNPTGIAGFGFDVPVDFGDLGATLPFDIPSNIPTPNGTS